MSGSREALLGTFLGNQRQKQTLIELTNDGRLCHALLLTGPSGCGRRTFARLAAAAMLCEGPERPCGVCRNCRKIMEGVHPDVITLDCGDTEQNGHKIDTLRTKVLDTVFTAPNEAARKVYILANFENMSAGTPNALLKTLEEPPAHAAFILTALSRQRLLETILSRVVSIELEPLPDETVAEELARRHPEAEPELRRTAADFSFGCLGEAEDILRSPERQELTARARAAVDALTGGDEYGLLAALTLPDKKKDSFRTLLRTVQLTLREGMEASVTGRGRGPGGVLGGRLPLRVWAEYVSLFEDAAGKIDRNVNSALIAADTAARAFRRGGVPGRG